jgi:hypothetical protein
MQTSENVEKDPDDPQPAEGGNKRNTPELYRPSTGAETKNYVQELRSL